MIIFQSVHKEGSAGFTLIELLVTLTIMGVVTLIAVPSLHSYIRSSHVKSATNDLIGALNYTRSEAVTRHTTISLCKSDDNTSCDTSSDGWDQGWIIFIDNDADGDIDSSDTILRSQTPFSSDLSITGDDNVADFVSYAATGFLESPWDGDETISVTATGKTMDILISGSGRVHVEE